MSMDNPSPTSDIDWRRQIEKRLGRVERRGGGVANAVITGGGETNHAPGLPADNVPTTPPQVKPVVTVTGFNDAFTVLAGEGFEPTTLLDYYCDGLLVASTTATLIFATKDGSGDEFVEDHPYVWQVVARNDLGTLESDPVVGLLVPNVDSGVVLGWVSAGFVLAGKIQVGEMTWEAPSADNPGGLKIPLLNGGLIHFPADGSDAIITAVLHARSLISDDFMEIYGDNNKLFGTMTVPNGVTDPQVPLNAVTSWDDTGTYDTTGNFAFGGATPTGFYDNGTEWLYCNSGAVAGDVVAVNKSTGVRTVKCHFTDLRPFGGIAKLGSTWYVLGYDASAGWVVQKLNSSFVQTGARIGAPTFGFGFSGGKPSIASDGTNIYVAQIFNATGTSQYYLDITKCDSSINTISTTDAAVSGTWEDLKSFAIGTFDFGGTVRGVIATATKVYVVTLSTGIRVSSQEWARANNEPLAGVTYDGANFRSLSASTERVYLYLGLLVATTRSIRWTRYSSISGHETGPSPALSFVQPPRSWIRVDTPPPGAIGSADDPDSVRIYIANHLQTALGVGVTTTFYGNPGTGGAAAPSNSFTSAPSPGYESQAADGDGPLTAFPGDGSYRLAGHDKDDDGLVAITVVGTTTGTVLFAYRRKNGYMTIEASFSYSTNAIAVGTTTIAAAGSIPAALIPHASLALGNGCRLSGFSGNWSVLADGSVTVDNQTGAARASVRGIMIYPIL